ncbi:hypothetical protein Leryth_009697 [Lithospermum erythrorhizon]|uniref:Glycosyltransferase n=1 Tax=Lithospermum erythrorhizon TaxID=34254 RepID=A0AAV3PFF4_LITER|nr:hypothetical protein Leryth_009697 [Lithospermum erythrorhizon]
MCSETKPPHAIMICYPLQGHINPFINLAMKLASNGFTITFVHTEYVHQQITKAQSEETTDDQVDIFCEARKSGLDIKYTTLSDGLPLDFNRSLNFYQYLESVHNDFPSVVDEFVGNLIDSGHSCSSSETFLIADTFQSWPGTVSRKYNLVYVSLWTQPASIFTLYYHLDLLKEHGHVPFRGDHDEIISCIPGMKPTKMKDLMSFIRHPDLSPIMQLVHKIVFQAFEDVKKANFILYNTMEELEPEILSALNKKQPGFAIGPLCSTDFTNNLVSRSLWSESDCTQWLGSKNKGSVLYVSFGSLAQLDEHVFVEIAHGLLLSEMNFIWVLRPGIVKSENDIASLYTKLANDSEGRGLMVPWCRQNDVLSHHAIGGFLTHCGWNSILESMWWGVPMICSPFFGDQLTNRKLVVDDLKIGINLCDGEVITREEVAEKIKHLMTEKSCDGLFKEVQQVKKILVDAMSENGSSQENIQLFIKDLKDEMHKRCQ